MRKRNLTGGSCYKLLIGKMEYLQVLLLALCLPWLCMSVHAQRRNPEGLKMVKRVNVHWYDENNNLIEGWSHDMLFDYNAKGRLIELVNKFQSADKDDYVEQYRKEWIALEYVKFKNGKADPDDKIRFILKDGLVQYKICDVAVWENDFSAIAYRKRHIYEYNYLDGKPVSRDYKRYYGYEHETIEQVVDIEWNSSLQKRYENMERECGMKKQLLVYQDDAGNLYVPDQYSPGFNLSHYSYFDGNRYNGEARRLKDLRFEKNVFLDRLNDTNVDFSCINSQNAEWCTEWVNARSQNLIIYEDKSQLEVRNTYEYTWDEQGNITQVKKIRTESGPVHGIYCVMDIEYVY